MEPMLLLLRRWLRPLHYVAGGLPLCLNVHDNWVKTRNNLDETHERIIGMLLEKGACVSERDRFGCTAFDYTVCLDRKSIIGCLEKRQEEERDVVNRIISS